MTSYERCRGFCTLWCSLEVLLFSGVIYGWSSLVSIFINEGFYSDLCIKTSNVSTQLPIQHEEFNVDIHNNSTTFSLETHLNCAEQESWLGLWFSISIGCTWAGMAILGPLSKALGTRTTRIIVLFIYEAGLLCLSFSTQESPWLVCPGLCCIGMAGICHFVNNIQVANLFTTFSSTIVALFCGLFDSSSIIFQVVKIAYTYGIGYKTSFLFLGCLHLLMIGTSTFFILPKCYISGPTKNLGIQIPVKNKINYQVTEINCDIEKQVVKKLLNKKPKESIKSHITSFTYISHVIWMTVNCLLFVTFLNILYIRVDMLSNGEKYIASYYLGVFAYTTIGSVIVSVIAGVLYDRERKRYKGSPFPLCKWRPVVIPMLGCGVFITTVFSFMIKGGVTFLLPSFVVFTLFRNFLFAIAIGFLNDAFPVKYFSHLYGIMTFINGLFSLLQYGLVKWTISYPEAYSHVHILLILLSLTTFLHPLQLWIRSERLISKERISEVAILTKSALLPTINEST